MFASFTRHSSRSVFRSKHLFQKAIRSFSVLENRLAFLDLFSDNEDGSEYDRNGMKLPPFGSIVSYTSNRQYHIGIYEGSKIIDGIQKLQIRNEHACLRDVVLRVCNMTNRLE